MLSVPWEAAGGSVVGLNYLNLGISLCTVTLLLLQITMPYLVGQVTDWQVSGS